MTARPAYAPVIHAPRHGPGGPDELFAITRGAYVNPATRLETIRRGHGSALTLTNQRLNAVYFTAPPEAAGVVYTKMGLAVIGACTTPSFARMGLYTADTAGQLILLVARTANDTTFFSGGGIRERVMDTTGGYPASYTVTAGSRYALACLSNAGVNGTAQGEAPGAAVITFTLLPVIEAIISAQADLPTGPVTPIGSAATMFQMWLAP